MCLPQFFFTSAAAPIIFACSYHGLDVHITFIVTNRLGPGPSHFNFHTQRILSFCLFLFPFYLFYSLSVVTRALFLHLSEVLSCCLRSLFSRLLVSVPYQLSFPFLLCVTSVFVCSPVSPTPSSCLHRNLASSPLS